MEDPPEITVTEFCNQVVTEVTELRFVPSTVGPHSAPSQVLEELWEVRARLERVEELMLQTYQLKEKLHRAHTANKAISKDKWNEEADKLANGRRGRMGDLGAFQERNAEIELKILKFKREERESEEAFSIAHETFEYVQMIQKGIERYKRDLEVIIRVYQIEVSIGGRR